MGGRKEPPRNCPASAALHLEAGHSDELDVSPVDDGCFIIADGRGMLVNRYASDIDYKGTGHDDIQ
jgi:hypothetical protein